MYVNMDLKLYDFLCSNSPFYISLMKAIEELNKGTVPNIFHFYIRPVYQFLYQYIIRLGIFDGKKGIIICFLNAYSVYIRFQELKKLRSNN
mgnify:CR=1 FL=1